MASIAPRDSMTYNCARQSDLAVQGVVRCSQSGSVRQQQDTAEWQVSLSDAQILATIVAFGRAGGIVHVQGSTRE